MLEKQQPDLVVDAAILKETLRRGFPWHTPDVPHLEVTTPDAWWSRLYASALVPTCQALGLSFEAAQLIMPSVRDKYLAPAGWVVFPDSVGVLGELAEQGWIHTIVSNHVPELEGLVNALGLSPFIERVITSATVGYEKPHPKMFEAAIQAAGPCEAVWMIGDHYEVDVLGAHAAGLPAILVRHEHPDAAWCSLGLADVINIVKGDA